MFFVYFTSAGYEAIQFPEREIALLLRFFLLVEQAAYRVLQVWFLLAIGLVPLVALDCLQQGVLKITSHSAPHVRAEHRV